MNYVTIKTPLKDYKEYLQQYNVLTNLRIF